MLSEMLYKIFKILVSHSELLFGEAFSHTHLSNFMGNMQNQALQVTFHRSSGQDGNLDAFRRAHCLYVMWPSTGQSADPERHVQVCSAHAVCRCLSDQRPVSQQPAEQTTSQQGEIFHRLSVEPCCFTVRTKSKSNHVLSFLLCSAHPGKRGSERLQLQWLFGVH